jgi:hypothetical protein
MQEEKGGKGILGEIPLVIAPPERTIRFIISQLLHGLRFLGSGPPDLFQGAADRKGEAGCGLEVFRLDSQEMRVPQQLGPQSP